MSQAARIARRIHIDDPEILAQVYKSYGEKHLHKFINGDLHAVNGLLKGLAQIIQATRKPDDTVSIEV